MATRPSTEALVQVFSPWGMSEIGAWRLLGLRSGGAYGSVYRAEPLQQPGSGPFALKLALHPMDPRFPREAELLRRVRHPHVPLLYDSGLWEHPAGPFPFLVMEWIEGQSLYAWAHGRVLSTRQMMTVLAPLARALAATHGVGAVHRDVKGDNVLVRPEDSHPMLIDFGAGDFRGAPPLTREVLPPGTPGYLSPEALLFHWRYWRTPGASYKPGPADDLYALGVTAYRLVTGAYPPPPVPPEVLEWDSSSPTLESEPPEKWATVSPELAGLIRQLLSEQSSARGSAEQVAQALEESVRSAGRHADEPVLPRARVAPAGRKRRRSPSRPARAGRPWLSAVAGVTAGVGLATALMLHGSRPFEPQASLGPPEDLSRPERAEGGEDAGTSLAREVLMGAHAEQPEPTWEALTVEMAKKPLPGQARAPCKQRGSVEINGVCWWGRPEATPPCREGEHEWGGRCYHPALVPTPPATSEER